MAGRRVSRTSALAVLALAVSGLVSTLGAAPPAQAATTLALDATLRLAADHKGEAISARRDPQAFPRG